MIHAATTIPSSYSLPIGDKVARTHVELRKERLAAFLDLEAPLARLRLLAQGQGVLAEEAYKLVVLLDEKPEGPWEE
jgi:hypothetical protein